MTPHGAPTFTARMLSAFPTIGVVLTVVVSLAVWEPGNSMREYPPDDVADGQETRRGFVRVGADRLYVEEAGTGPPILLLHDGLIHSAGMDSLFNHLAERHRVVRYDRRGYGRSDMPTEQYSSVADMAAVLDHAGVEQAVLLGASAGGANAIEAALAFPDRVAALVLVGAVVFGHPYSDHFVRRAELNMAPLETGDYRAAMRNWVDDPYQLAPGKKEARDRLWQLIEPYAKKHLTPLDSIERPTSSSVARLPDIRVPTLIVVGEADTPDVHAQAGIIEAGVRDSKRVVVVDAGHLVFFERPSEVSRLVLEFLERSATTRQR